MMWNSKYILMHGSITSIMWAWVCAGIDTVLMDFVWNSPSVHTVDWFTDVLLEVMMILTLSHFENQLHPSCHADASSHAVDSFFCTVRGSYGKRLGKKKKQNNINVKDFSFSISDVVQWLEPCDLAIKHWFMTLHYITAMCSHSIM